MRKRIYHFLFITIFFICIIMPFLHTEWIDGGISLDENRTLSDLPALFTDNKFNENFTSEFEDWFMDHLGYRNELISLNATIQSNLFDRLLTQSNYHIGPQGDINYATMPMIENYAHTNLRSDERVAEIGDSYQIISNWLKAKGIPFYYVQCWDKHSIYPEQFTDTINQIGNISKTDQIISYLRNHTDVNTLSLKEVLINSKDTYEVYSNWGDPTHWSDRGAYIGYQYILQNINLDFNSKYKILSEDDYNITINDQGIYLNGVIHQDDFLEKFELKQPFAKRINSSPMGEFSADTRNGIWINPNAGNNDKLLLVCDSYIKSYIVDDLAESFAEVWLIWNDYTTKIPEIIETYQPNLVIYECAERVDKSHDITILAQYKISAQ